MAEGNNPTNLLKYSSQQFNTDEDKYSQHVGIQDNSTLPSAEKSSNHQSQKGNPAQSEPIQTISRSTNLNLAQRASDPYKLVHGISDDSSDMDDSHPLTCGQRQSSSPISGSAVIGRRKHQSLNLSKEASQNQEESRDLLLNSHLAQPSIHSIRALNTSSNSVFDYDINNNDNYFENFQDDTLLQELGLGEMNSSSTDRGTRSGKYTNSSKQTKYYSPTNPTLESMGKNTVILIKFTKEDTKRIFANPILMQKLISESIFSTLRIKDVRTNRMKNLIAVEAREPLTNSQIERLIPITKIGEYNIKCEIPNSDRYKHGVIYPIDENIPLDELKDQIMLDNNIQIFKLERLKKKMANNKWMDSQSVKVTVTNNDMPPAIKINYMRYKIRPYIQEPMQCFRCQRLGHTSKSCKSKNLRCMLCGDSHDKKVCESECRKCVNCNGAHAANSKLCPFIQHAQKIEKLKATQNIDHSTARSMVTQDRGFTEEQFPQLENTQSHSAINSQYSYANIVRNNIIEHSTTPQHVGRSRNAAANDIGTQTTEINMADNKGSDSKFLMKLRNFILDITNINFTKESHKARMCLVDGAIRNNFGIDITNNGRKGSDSDVNSDMEHEHGDQSKEEKKRKRNKSSENSDTDVEVQSLQSSQDEDVISDADAIWETVEKKQVKKKNKNKQNIGESTKSKKSKSRRKNE